MKKVLWVAAREFAATVATKGFIIAVLMTPLIIGLMAVFLPILFNETPPEVEGEVAIIDPTGAVADGVREHISPQAIARRWDLVKEEIEEQIPDEIRELATAGGNQEAFDAALDGALSVPKLDLRILPPGADLEAEKEPLRDGEGPSGGRLALVAVAPDAVVPEGDGYEYGSYELFVREKVDDRIEDEIKVAVRKSIVAARIQEANYPQEQIEALTRVARVRSKMVTDEGEQETNEILNVMLPAGFMILLLVSVMTAGQYILTTTVEEKSSRVVEVLLSAVSPMELMTGKILGQAAVGMVILVLYSGLGIAGLVSFAMLGLIDLWLLPYLFIFFVIAYLIIGSLMAAIGAAVNEMREAQALMTPVMMTVMIPWLFWMPITRDPNSMFATITSFIPPLNTYVMLLRMTSSTPPPMWQVWLSILVGVASVYGALWIAAKVFRVGLLMFGKPPSFRTLIQWVRMS